MNTTTSPFMRRALELADAAVGRTAPNPPVGAVVVRDGVIVGEGAYCGPGTPHAEIAALLAAGEAARGASVYVTLEPCAHDVSSETGSPRLSCSRALIEAGVARVVFALVDPDPRTSGAGRDALVAAGVAVETGDGAAESSRILEGYLKHRTTGRPFVVAKFVASLDGKIAAASGDSRWVSGPATLIWAHALRTRIDAIMVGVSTVLIDNPQLTARPGGVEAERQPLRVVVDSSGRTPAEARVLAPPARTLVATTTAAPSTWRSSVGRENVEVVELQSAPDGRVSLPHLLDELGRRGILTLLVEGGGVLLGSFFDQRLVDKLHAVIAPKIIGAASAAGPVAGVGADRMADAITMRDLIVDRLGDDVLITGYPLYPGR
ncbi:MAG TPA: bifunctional diaminohydroxyphosphoribosylaminopyrimidine deaminase/5-amino-6-(5-phosphoribosylamino)uracil reductase RibD [Dehalococcoidia bacterium]|nr:bifunctional diaminohydroxyphosphoribosylaminopyrimidine deaminase/5-amino-6-(5-phosphoribosylamino)uracil reductase RibD [Dehalococcoidia bacterium]